MQLAKVSSNPGKHSKTQNLLYLGLSYMGSIALRLKIV